MGRLTLAAAVVALVCVAAASAGSSPVYLSSCGTLVQRPHAVVLACADANYELVSLSWKTWGGPTAAATGKVRANTCTPNCAGGRFRTYPVEVGVLGARRCGSKRIYLKLTLDYPGRRPTGHSKHEEWPVTCAQALR
jgi:hypothetical protein